MIYTSPIESITWHDVDEFCKQGIVEGSYLDYKIDFPNELGRTIAAMANTLGGVILLGVQEGRDGKPVLPFAGIPLERGIAERVTNIVLSSITPPIFPEVAVCPNSEKKAAVVVIRVPQSPDTPHATAKNTRVYLRTGNRNKPEDLATLDQIEWLQAKRTRSIALREHLHSEAIKRSDVFFRHVNRTLGVRIAHRAQMANLILNVAPVFPARTFLTPPELKRAYREIQFRDYYGTDTVFPPGTSNATLLQDGVYVGTTLGSDGGHESYYYTELSVFGQIFYRQSLDRQVDDRRLMRASEIFVRLDEFAALATHFSARLSIKASSRSNAAFMRLTPCP